MDHFTSMLPAEICLLIDSFNCQYRDNMIEVLQELSYQFTLTTCDNDTCENEISTETAVVKRILGGIYYYCDVPYCGYGEWSLRYDYRKSRR